MFELTKSQNEIQKAAKDFAKGEFDKEFVLELEKKREYPKTIHKKAAELGFIGIHFPEAYSGGDLGALENCLVVEEFCRQNSTMGCVLSYAGYASESILRFGTKEMKEKYLPEISEGRMLSGGAFCESDIRLDFASINTTAIKDTDEWLINGTKKYVVNSSIANFYIVLCLTDPENKGISMILVEADRNGVSVDETGDKLGFNMMPISNVTFKNTRVPISHLIGKEGNGISQVQEVIDEIKILNAAQAVGIAQGVFDRTIDYVKQREQFGKKIAQFQITRHKLADMVTKIELSRLITYKAAANLTQRRNDPKLPSMAKLFATNAAVEVADEGVQLLGGYGYMTEYEIEGFYRDAKVIEITNGNREIQKDTISDEIIGRIK